MEAIILIAILIGSIFLFRVLGAWMFRINEIITILKEINNKLNK